MTRTAEEIRKTYPTGRECSEDCCMYLAPKTDAPLETSDCKPGDFECVGKAKEWPDCPRAIRAERDALLEQAWRFAEVAYVGGKCEADRDAAWDWMQANRDHYATLLAQRKARTK